MLKVLNGKLEVLVQLVTLAPFTIELVFFIIVSIQSDNLYGSEGQSLYYCQLAFITISMLANIFVITQMLQGKRTCLQCYVMIVFSVLLKEYSILFQKSQSMLEITSYFIILYSYLLLSIFNDNNKFSFLLLLLLHAAYLLTREIMRIDISNLDGLKGIIEYFFSLMLLIILILFVSIQKNMNANNMQTNNANNRCSLQNYLQKQLPKVKDDNFIKSSATHQNDLADKQINNNVWIDQKIINNISKISKTSNLYIFKELDQQKNSLFNNDNSLNLFSGGMLIMNGQKQLLKVNKGILYYIEYFSSRKESNIYFQNIEQETQSILSVILNIDLCFDQFCNKTISHISKGTNLPPLQESKHSKQKNSTKNLNLPYNGNKENSYLSSSVQHEDSYNLEKDTEQIIIDTTQFQQQIFPNENLQQTNLKTRMDQSVNYLASQCDPFDSFQTYDKRFQNILNNSSSQQNLNNISYQLKSDKKEVDNRNDPNCVDLHIMNQCTTKQGVTQQQNNYFNDTNVQIQQCFIPENIDLFFLSQEANLNVSKLIDFLIKSQPQIIEESEMEIDKIINIEQKKQNKKHRLHSKNEGNRYFKYCIQNNYLVFTLKRSVKNQQAEVIELKIGCFCKVKLNVMKETHSFEEERKSSCAASKNHLGEQNEFIAQKNKRSTISYNHLDAQPSVKCNDNSQRQEIEYVFSLEISQVNKEIQNIIKAEKERFTSKLMRSISHELRTPLNCTITMLDVLNLRPDIPELCKNIFINPALFSSYILLNIINDILDMAEVNKSGQIQMLYQQFSPVEACLECLNFIKLQASSKGLLLEFTQQNDIPLTINSDLNKTRQILLNLLSNALKFTQKGTICIHLSLHSADTIQVEVRDTGCGIPLQKLKQIFKSIDYNDTGDFIRQSYSNYQRQSVSERKLSSKKKNSHTNVGFGLTISYILASCLGKNKKLFAKSEVGKGSTFVFYIYNQSEAKTNCTFQPKNLQESAHTSATLWEEKLSCDLFSSENTFNNIEGKQFDSKQMNSIGQLKLISEARTQDEREQQVLSNQNISPKKKITKKRVSVVTKPKTSNEFERILKEEGSEGSEEEEDSHPSDCDCNFIKTEGLLKYNESAQRISQMNIFSNNLNRTTLQLIRQASSIFQMISSQRDVTESDEGNQINNKKYYTSIRRLSNHGQTVESKSNFSKRGLSEDIESEQFQIQIQSPILQNSFLHNQQTKKPRKSLIEKSLKNTVNEINEEEEAVILQTTIKQGFNKSSEQLDSKYNIHEQPTEEMNESYDKKYPNNFFYKIGKKPNNNKQESFKYQSNYNSSSSKHTTTIIANQNSGLIKNNTASIAANQYSEKQQISLNSILPNKSSTIIINQQMIDANLESDQMKEPLDIRKLVQNLNNQRKCNCSQILVVDDNEFNVIALEMRLQLYSFLSDKAFSGFEAIELIQKKYQNNCCKNYTLVFMDIDMPIMNGYETTRQILQICKNQNIKSPIVSACSAFVQQSDKDKAYESGMSYYVCKPIHQSEFEHVISKVFLQT